MSRSMPAVVSLGCMNFGKRTDRATSMRILAAALDSGVSHLDTANMYVDGESERIVGQALRGRHDVATVATKVGFLRVNGKPEGLAPARVLAACDESLARLGVDSIDLYYLHAPDRDTPIEATLAAIATLLENGKIKAWGVSNYASWQILEMMHLADGAGMPRPAVAQLLYNLLVRQLDLEYFAFSQRYPLRTTVFNVLAGGMLSGSHTSASVPAPGSRFDKNPLYRRRYWQEPVFHAAAAYAELAAANGMSLIELAYAFVFRHAHLDSVLVGPATEAHLTAALRARELELSPELSTAIDNLAYALAGTDAKYAR